MGTPITARIAVAWAAIKGTLASGTSAPLPGRFGHSQNASWLSSLTTFASQFQPVPISEAREGEDNSIVDICVNYIATSWSLAVAQVGTENGDKFEPVPGEHWLSTLLSNPNPDMDGDTLLWGMIGDYIRRGNAYAHILSTRGGVPAALEYLPSKNVEPIADKLGRLDKFKYTVDGEIFYIPKTDVLHVRHGIDPNNLLLGRSPLAAQYREIVTDNRAADWQAGMMKMGIPQVIFTPRANAGEIMSLTRDEAREISNSLNEKFAAEPGRPRVLPGSLEMHKTGLSPSDMAINDGRGMPETRIPAALGLPPLVLQLFNPMQKSTFSNMDAAIKQAWRGCILPMMSVFSSAITRQVLYKSSADMTAKRVVRFDTSGVQELQVDMVAVRDAARADKLAGIITIDEARAEQGKEPEESLNNPPAAPAPDPSRPNDPNQPNTRSLVRNVKVANVDAGDVYSAADAYRRKLMADETAAIDALAAAWAKAIRATQQRLAELVTYLGEAEDGGVPIDERLTATAERLSELLPQMESQLVQLSERGAAIIENGQRSMILSASEGAASLAAAQGISEWNRLPVETFESLVGFTVDKSPVSNLLDLAFGDMAEAVRTRLLTAVAQGKNPRAVAATIASITGESKARTEAICRTEMLRASREASRMCYQANRDVLEGWVRLSAADTRTCAACWALHGQFHHTDDIMPTHVQCRCVMVPQPRSIEGIRMGVSIPLGEDLFSELSEADQIEILGPGRFEQWKGGASLTSFAQVSNDPTWGPTVDIRPVKAPTPMEAPV